MTSLPEVGTEFAGYRLEAYLARGGMGVVYSATHLRLSRQVALKLLAPELDSDQDFRARFLREVALWLAHARDAGVFEGESSTAEPKSDREYWPDLDLQAVQDRVGAFFSEAEEVSGRPRTYPGWAIRRFIATEVLAAAGLKDPQGVGADMYELTVRWPRLMVEDPQLDEAVERLLEKHHLREPVQILFDSFTT